MLVQLFHSFSITESFLSLSLSLNLFLKLFYPKALNEDFKSTLSMINKIQVTVKFLETFGYYSVYKDTIYYLVCVYL